MISKIAAEKHKIEKNKHYIDRTEPYRSFQKNGEWSSLWAVKRQHEVVADRVSDQTSWRFWQTSILESPRSGKTRLPQ